MAFWSLKRKSYKDPGHIYTALRDHIQQEEMLHMGIICNLLVGLNETVDLTSEGCHPKYPTPLLLDPDDPNHESEFEIPLMGYSDEALDIFLKIEYPKDDPIEIENHPSPDPGMSNKQQQDAQKTAQTIG